MHPRMNGSCRGSSDLAGSPPVMSFSLHVSTRPWAASLELTLSFIRKCSAVIGKPMISSQRSSGSQQLVTGTWMSVCQLVNTHVA